MIIICLHWYRFKKNISEDLEKITLLFCLPYYRLIASRFYKPNYYLHKYVSWLKTNFKISNTILN